MDGHSRHAPLDERDEAELTMYADGSLPPDRESAIAARIAAEPGIKQLVGAQRAGAEAVRVASAEVFAPAGLRAQIDSLGSARAPARRRRQFMLGGSFAAAAAAVAVAIVAALPSDTPGSPAVVEAAAFAEKRATEPAPGRFKADPKLLAIGVSGTPFPNYLAKFGWKATGVRHDDLDGRNTVTVFYEQDGKRIGYTIVPGAELEGPDDATRASREGTVLETYDADGRLAVTWERNGHTCVMSGDGVARAELLDLAGWKGKGSVPF